MVAVVESVVECRVVFTAVVRKSAECFFGMRACGGSWMELLGAAVGCQELVDLVLPRGIAALRTGRHPVQMRVTRNGECFVFYH